MSDGEHPRFIIVGGGLGGALFAVHFGKAGFPVEVHELRGDLRVEGIVAGRSINLALSHRGICALQEVGLADDVLKLAIPMKGRMIHSPAGALSFQPYGAEPNQAIYSISRSSLNMALLNAAARSPNVRFFFHERCSNVDLETGAVEFTHTETNEKRSVDGGIVISADGAFSTVRQRMQRMDRFNYRQDYLEHGYKELTIPPAEGGRHRIEKNALHIWPRKSYMMIALPNMDGSFTCTLFWQLDGPVSFSATRTPEEVRTFFNRSFPDAVPLMPHLTDEFFRNPTSTLVTVRCGPWHVEDRIVLLGDAAHAVVPFYGQGMNAAFEDVLVLRECVEKNPGDLNAAFREYDRLRKPNVDALAELALQNFVEMRDKTGNRSFRWKKKVEHVLHRLFPRWFVPLYTMVTFTRIPYAEARRRAIMQDRALVAGGVLLFGLLLSVLLAVARIVAKVLM